MVRDNPTRAMVCIPGSYSVERHGRLFDALQRLLIRRVRQNATQGLLAYLRTKYGDTLRRDEVVYKKVKKKKNRKQRRGAVDPATGALEADKATCDAKSSPQQVQRLGRDKGRLIAYGPSGVRSFCVAACGVHEHLTLTSLTSRFGEIRHKSNEAPVKCACTFFNKIQKACCANASRKGKNLVFKFTQRNNLLQSIVSMILVEEPLVDFQGCVSCKRLRNALAGCGDLMAGPLSRIISASTFSISCEDILLTYFHEKARNGCSSPNSVFANNIDFDVYLKKK